ncbi:RNA-directed DNA polymerase, eukaryota [Tanacetum coccineum]
MGNYRLRFNLARFQRGNKPPSNTQKGHIHVPHKINTVTMINKSYASALNKKGEGENTSGGTQVVVIDEECFIDKNLDLTLVAKVKSFESLPNLKVICNQEGFKDITIWYLGGFWVALEFMNAHACEKFRNHAGASSWFTLIIPWSKDFIVDERVSWVDIEGVLISVIHAREIIRWNLEFIDEDNENDSNSDVERSERKRGGKSDDPFGLYDLLNKGNQHEESTKEESDSLSKPPGFEVRVTNEDMQHTKKHVEVNVESGGKSGSRKEGFGDSRSFLEVSVPSRYKPRSDSLIDQSTGSCTWFTMNVLSLNIQGVGSKEKIKWVKELCSSRKVNFLTLHETKVEQVDEVLVKSLWGNSSFDYAFSLSVGYLGGMVCVWDKSTFIKENVSVADYFLLVEGEWKCSVSKERLNDIPLGGYKFTWVHKNADKMSKLDQFLVSDGVLASFPSLTVVILDKHLSDHRPIFLHELQGDYGPVPFRLYHSWFLIKGFDSFVRQAWQEDKMDERNSMVYLKKKLQMLKQKLRAWGKATRNDLDKKQLDIQSEICELDKKMDSGCLSASLMSSQASLQKSLPDLDKIRDTKLAQKVKLKWAIEWDENSRYFHGSFPRSLSNEQADILEAMVTDQEIKMQCGIMMLNELVSSEQSAFIRGRQILDGPMILNEGFFKGGVSNDEVERVARLIGCEAAKIPFNYLGVVVGDHMSHSGAWNKVVDRLVSRLSNWKAQTLSIGGRLTLIKSMLGSLPTYYFSLFKVPSLVLKMLESLRSCFFHGANDRDKKMAWVSWDKVLSNKKNGVLRSVDQLKRKWVDIMSFVYKEVGDGRDSLFWLDPWLEDVPLNCKFPRVYALEENKQVSVGEKLKLGLCASLRRLPRGGVESSQMDNLRHMVDRVVLLNKPDS